MSDYSEIIEADKAYLEKAGMRDLLQQFVADAMEEHPEDIYEFMAAWATEKSGKQAADDNAHAQKADEVPAYAKEDTGAGDSMSEL